ncbi:MAG: hypothetical protein KDA87_23685, partial [Planctomycetales bacterium]|nr:hypothetical protein [Planctomycetales bacterium]
HRRVFEIQNVGPEGGEYACPVGSLTLNQEATEAVIAVAQDATNIGGFTVARSLLASLAVDSSEYDPVFAAFVDNVSVKDVFNVNVRLRRPYLRIESLFAVPIRGAETQSLTPYAWQEDGNTADRFIVNKAYSFGEKQQPREITERLFSETRLAVDAFRRGEIDMIDRVFPADVAQLTRDDSMVVDSYRIPSTHMLIPNFERPFPGTRAFRAAIAYGIDREQILSREILGGQKIEGCRVISGPFSPGVRQDDPLGYAYDLRIEPRPYEPRLSKLRLQLAQIEINATAEKAKEDPPKLGELVIVHPADEIARIACAEIVRYLAPLGLTCKLEELSPGADRPEHNDWDFLYTELVIHEPIADAGRLFAADGFAKIPSAYVNLALLQLQRVRNWNEAGQRLRSIHQVCFDEVAVIPLWQLVDHFVYRAGLQGVTRRPVNLYQEVEKWRISTN